MIREVLIENYKSIQALKLNLGRITVFIGENGCGKTNILEAIALAAAAASDKLDNEFLVSRGIRVTEPQFMRSAFDSDNREQNITIQLKGGEEIEEKLEYVLNNDNAPYSKWTCEFIIESSPRVKKMNEFIKEFIVNANHERNEINPSSEEALISQNKLDEFHEYLDLFEAVFDDLFGREIKNPKNRNLISSELKEYLVFSPQYSTLRFFEKEGQIQPLGIKGEGLL